MEPRKVLRNKALLRGAEWLTLTLAMIGICFWYYSSARGDRSFPLPGAAGIITVASAAVFFRLKIHTWLFDRTYAGTVEQVRIRTSPSGEKDENGKMILRRIARVTVNLKDGGGQKVTEMVLDDSGTAAPLTAGDRVLHLRGAEYLCRFPRNGQSDGYVNSVICPLCGAVNTLGRTDCAFCVSLLPTDPGADRDAGNGGVH